MKRVKNSIPAWTVLTIVAVLASCLTINVYFPAAAVQQAADTFVKDVQGNSQNPQAPTTGSGTPAPGPTKKAETGWLRWQIIRNAVAQAEEAIKIDTPEARRLKDAMKGKYPEISSFKEKGAIGEDKDGLLAERDLQVLALPERAKAKQLISETNQERTKLYEEVVRANNYPKEKLKEVQSIFAKSWQANSKAGWWIQQADGSWAKK